MQQHTATLSFSDPGALAWLEAADDDRLDTLDFGVVGMNGDDTVVAYNDVESRISGLSRRNVVGRNFFNDVAPCTNNFMVAQRYADETTLDEIVPYVFTLRMRPRRVRLRLLKGAGCARAYLLVETLR